MNVLRHTPGRVTAWADGAKQTASDVVESLLAESESSPSPQIFLQPESESKSEYLALESESSPSPLICQRPESKSSPES